jgi:channel protein (hemolysin III family)
VIFPAVLMDWLVNIVGAWRKGDGINVVGAAVFDLYMALRYFTFSLFKTLPSLRAMRVKKLFPLLGRSAIHLLIAGAHTPFTFGILRRPWG